MAQNREFVLAIILDIAANVFWGASYMLNRIAYWYGSPITLLSLRFVTAFLVLWLSLRLRGRRIQIKGKHLLPLLFLITTEPFGYLMESYAIKYTNATMTGIAMAAVPVLSVMMAVVLLREKPTVRQMVCGMIPIIGVVLITISGSEIGVATPIGILCIALAAISYSTYRIANKKASEEFDPTERTVMMLGSGAFVFTMMALISNHGNVKSFIRPLSQPGFLIPLVILTLFCSILSNLMANYAVKRLSVIQYGIVGTVSTVCSMFCGVLFLKEPLTPMMLAGAFMILFGITQTSKK